MLWASVLFSLKERFTGSVFGLLWLILLPVLFTGLYSTVYAVYLQQTSGFEEQLLLILCGLIPFLSFAESYGAGVNSIVNSSSLIKNTLFYLELVPLRDVLVGHISMAAALALVLIGGEYYVGLSYKALFVIPLFILQILFVTGIVYIFAAMNVFMRDISKSTPVIMLLMMLITPIGVEIKDVPENYQFVFWYNPLSHFVEFYRDVIIRGALDLQKFGLLTLASLGTFFIGFWIVSKLRGVFVDYV